MTRRQILDLFGGITRGRTRGGHRAPHKPLLLLYALARFAEGDERLRYTEVETQVRALLQEFGPTGASDRIYYPFWRLQADDLWAVEEPLVSNRAGDVRRSVLVERDSVGRFTNAVADALRTRPSLVGDIIGQLLADEFTEAYDDEILSAIGFDLEGRVIRRRAPLRTARRRRDPTFRRRVLDAYEHRCAVCGFYATVSGVHVGLDAAHVIWHQYGGEDEEWNGLALCTLHHRLLDRGAFTIAASTFSERVVEVSPNASGNEVFGTWMLKYHGEPLADPVRAEYRISEPATMWHRSEVFKGQPRT